MHIAIIGNGISGITAARFLRKMSDHRITIISAETEYFFSRTALMYLYMGHMRFKDLQPYEPWFWEKNKLDLLMDYVEGVDVKSKRLQLSGGKHLAYDKLIIATGSVPNRFNWPGQNLKRVHGLYSIQDLEAMEEASGDIKRAVIVGGGLIGIEMAEMFNSRHIPVTFLVREDSYWNGVLPSEESAMVGREIRAHGIDLRLNEELKEILSDGNGRASGVITKHGERIDCEYVGLTAGVHPNIDFLKDSGIELDKGVLVNEYLETSEPDVYAIGDCAQVREPQEGRRSIEAVWYTGRIMGETVAYTLLGEKKAYDPGIWFNSAKFIDIEYQIYGQVPSELPESQKEIYWEHPDGRHAIRLRWSKSTGAILGFNLMGVRYRHEVCEKWIREGSTIEEVLTNLGLANFDPEFFKEYESELIKRYNEQEGQSLSLQRKRGLSAVLRFLHAN